MLQRERETIKTVHTLSDLRNSEAIKTIKLKLHRKNKRRWKNPKITYIPNIGYIDSTLTIN